MEFFGETLFPSLIHILVNEASIRSHKATTLPSSGCHVAGAHSVCARHLPALSPTKLLTSCSDAAKLRAEKLNLGSVISLKIERFSAKSYLSA